MNVQLPFGVIAIGISLYYFYSYDRKRKLKREERREHMAEKQEQLLLSLRKKSPNVQNVQVGETTSDAIKNNSRLPKNNDEDYAD